MAKKNEKTAETEAGIPRPDTTVPGGAFIVNGVLVNAEGKPLKREDKPPVPLKGEDKPPVPAE